MSTYFMFYNPTGQHEVLKAASENLAKRCHSVPRSNGRIKLFRCGNVKPNALEKTSIIESDTTRLAAKAIIAYQQDTAKGTKMQRAKRAFRAAFDRPANTKKRIWEAEALSVIVMLNGG